MTDREEGLDALEDDTDDRPTVVTCTVCGDDVGRGPGGLGQVMHAKRHRRQFRELYGRAPDSYQEVRDALGQGISLDDDRRHLTLAEAMTDDEQASLLEVDDGE